MGALTIENLSKSYGKNVIYDNFNLTVEEGKITCILGESGSGKTTLLNVVANLTSYQGNVTQVNPSYIFQTPRLVSNLTVYGNLRLVCKDDKRINELLIKVGLSDKRDVYPVKLSGGQAQRVSLCRAFLYGGDIILMDEPFTQLDLKLKISMMELFKDMCEERKSTALFVTHDIDEAVYLADRIVIIKRGKIIYDKANKQSQSFGEFSSARQEILNVLLN
jgi:ABC-type nitrate/sulfonate/bicarbonate transport system ATPase subunit